jgi:hypothetical protein
LLPGAMGSAGHPVAPRPQLTAGGAPRATDFYNAIHAPASPSPPPLIELNWDSLAPKKKLDHPSCLGATTF